jgi:Outer membrane protein beta-barrel domain
MKMKKLWAVLAFVSIAGAQVVQAQDDIKLRTGVRGGLNASNLYIKDISDRNPRYGFHVGAFTQVPLIGKVLVLQPEIAYSTKGTTATYNAFNLQGKNTFKLDYLEVPVLATLKLGNAVDIHLGPYAAYMINSSNNFTGDLGNVISNLNPDNFNRFDYGLAAGLTIYFGKAFLATRYNQGLNKIANSTQANVLLGDAKNSVGQLSVGFTF